MEKGVKTTNDFGVPQGGPLSPLLANIMLNELDKELRSQGIIDLYGMPTISSSSAKAKEAVKEPISTSSHFIEGRLRLKVNKRKQKSHTYET